MSDEPRPEAPSPNGASGAPDERRVSRLMVALLALSIAAGVGLLALYASGGQVQLEGALLFVLLAGIGFSLILWGKYLFPPEVVTEPRGDHPSSEEQRLEAELAFAEGEDQITRRSLLIRMLLGAVGALGLAAVFPIRSLGPSPGRALFETAWTPGALVVDESGQPVRVDDLVVGGVLTVFPEGFTDRSDSSAILVRVESDLLALPAGRNRDAPGERLLLEALHPRRVSRRAVPVPVPPVAVPVPLLRVRRADRSPAGVRAGRPAAAPASAVRGRPGPPAGAWRLHRPGRPRILDAREWAVIVPRVLRWFDQRLGAASFAKKSLRKVFPDHWSFMLGEVALYSFLILVITGVFLTFFYIPAVNEVVYNGPYRPLDGHSVSAAYQSVMRISFEVRAGLVFRQIHHWAALIMTGAVVFHAMRVFFTGAFRKPRDLNWVFGVLLLVLTLAIGFAGYSLPDDLLSGTGLRVAYSIALSIPVIGTWLAFLLFGGEYPAPDILNRLFVLHVMILPALIAGVMRRPPRDPVAAEAHELPGEGIDRRSDPGPAPVAAVRVRIGRAVLRPVRGARAPRRRGADQPDLDLRAVQPRDRQRRLAAGLVSGVHRGR